MLRKLSDYIKSRTSKLKEDASVTMEIWVVVLLFFALFMFSALGVVMDRLSGFQASFAAGSSLPVSADRVWITGAFIQGYWSLLIFSILLPILFYAIIVAKRRQDSGI